MNITRQLKILLLLVSIMLSPALIKLHAEEVIKRAGNIETVESIEKGKVQFRILYFYEGEKKVRGEYWEAVKDDNKKKPGSNILAGTAIAAKYEKTLAESNLKDDSGIVLDIQKDGFMLKSVRVVRYNANGQPEHVMARGYTSYPVLGVFILKTDYTYKYDASGKLAEINETNLNVDSLLLNTGIGNWTKIERDAAGRPLKVKRTLGSIPPATEQTVYTYAGPGDSMLNTVYQKCAVDTKSMSIAPSETITIEYVNDIPWSGMKKYEFKLNKTIKGISIYNEIEKKQVLDGANFMEMNLFAKAAFAKKVYDMYKNEQKGPKWRMGELPDVPEPFMIYNDFKWWE